MTSNDKVERGISLDVVRDGVLVIFHKDLVARGVDGEMEGRVQLGNMEDWVHMMTVRAPVEQTPKVRANPSRETTRDSTKRSTQQKPQRSCWKMRSRERRCVSPTDQTFHNDLEGTTAAIESDTGHCVKDTKVTISSNTTDYDSSTDYVHDGVFHLPLEKSTARQMVSFSPRASSGEAKQDIDEILTVHRDVL